MSLQVWRYGTLPAGEGPELYEAGLRVDATAYGACTTREDAATLLALLNGGLGHWLQAHWAGRLLLATDDGAARAYVAADPKALGRAPAEVPCGRDEKALAQHLLLQVCPQLFSPHGLEVRELVLHLDPGTCARVLLRHEQGAATACVAETAPDVTVWTKLCEKTKFGLVRPASRLISGDAS